MAKNAHIKPLLLSETQEHMNMIDEILTILEEEPQGDKENIEHGHQEFKNLEEIYMKKLEEKIEKLDGGLELVRIDTQNVIAKVNSLSRGKEKERHKFRRESKGSHDEGYGSYHRYALILWNKIATNIRGMRRAPIESWDELKREMRERFVPSFYTRDHFVKLIFQRNRSDINKSLSDIIELHDYTSLSTLVHQASKVELQLKRHSRRSYPTTSSNWKGTERKEEPPKRDRDPNKGSAPFKGQKDEVSKVSISDPNTSKSRKGDIATQCPNKRTMILRENGYIESESSKEETSTSSSESGY
ncbi:hypothetical protein CR513_46943, partial [Mucuna pruriens]